MSDLTGKFGSFEEQIASNHTEIMNALDTIASALGAPPPGPTTTLDDVVTALTQTNTILNGIRTDMNGYLLEIFNTLDAINTNASLNAQRLLATLLQTACACDPDVPLLPPDLGTTPISATDQAKCQRIQYFIDLYRSWVITVGQYVGNQGSISSFQVNNLLQVVLGNVDITTGELKSGMPISVRDSVTGQLASAVGSVGATGVDSGLFNAMATSNLEALRQALYGVTTAADGKAAADSAIEGLGLASWATNVLKTMFYSAWPNDIYSDVPAVDASAYDGTICAPESSCVTIESSFISSSAFGFSFNAIVWPSDWPRTNFYTRNSDTLGGAAVLIADLTGCTIRGIDAPIQVQTQSGSSGFPMGQVVELDAGITEMLVNSDTAFSVEFCGPVLPPPGLGS